MIKRLLNLRGMMQSVFLNRWAKLLLLVIFCVGLSGCELFSLPGQLIGGIFGLLGQAVQVAGSMPTPPPWMFF